MIYVRGCTIPVLNIVYENSISCIKILSKNLFQVSCAGHFNRERWKEPLLLSLMNVFWPCSQFSTLVRHVRFQTPFVLFLKYSFYYLTGKQFQTVVVKSCPKSANAYQKQEKSYCGPLGSRK